MLAETRTEIAAAFCVIILALAYYVYLIDLNPTIFWYDAIHRYAFPDDLTVDRWLPGSQLAIFVMRQLSSDAVATRVALAVISSLSLFAVWAYTRHISTPVAGLVAAIALFTNFVFASLATVPYGETLFIGCVLGALVVLDKPRTDGQYFAGTLLLVGACMTRYEGWFLAAILVAERLYAYYRGDRDRRTLFLCIAVATPILLWLLLGTSYTRPGESSIFDRMTVEHWREFLTGYGRLLRWQEVDPWIVLAPVGFALAWLQGTHRAMHLRALLFAGLTFAMIALVEPYAGLNFRVTFVTLVFVHVYASIAVVMLTKMAVLQASRRFALPRTALLFALIPLAFAAALAVYHTSRTTDFVRRASSEPHFYGAQLAGRWLRDQPREDAVIFGLTDDILQHFSIAGMSNTPVSAVLVDDAVRTDMPSKRTYVLAVYQREERLTRNEKALLDALTSGAIPGEMVSIGPARAWIIDP